MSRDFVVLLECDRENEAILMVSLLLMDLLLSPDKEALDEALDDSSRHEKLKVSESVAVKVSLLLLRRI